jgi:hypothetical protein
MVGQDPTSSALRISTRTTGFMELCDLDDSGDVSAREFSNVFLGKSVRSIILDKVNANTFNPDSQPRGLNVHHSGQQEVCAVLSAFGFEKDPLSNATAVPCALCVVCFSVLVSPACPSLYVPHTLLRCSL